MKTPESKKIMYLLAVYAAKEGGFWTRFADFPASDQGETLEEALDNATEFLQGIVNDYSKTMKKPLPIPSSIEEFKKKLDQTDGEPVCIMPIFAMLPSPAIRIQLTANANAIRTIDDYARKSGCSRSRLMVDATLDYIRANQ